jgi:hypothetical protein
VITWIRLSGVVIVGVTRGILALHPENGGKAMLFGLCVVRLQPALVVKNEWLSCSLSWQKERRSKDLKYCDPMQLPPTKNPSFVIAIACHIIIIIIDHCPPLP